MDSPEPRPRVRPVVWVLAVVVVLAGAACVAYWRKPAQSAATRRPAAAPLSEAQIWDIHAKQFEAEKGPAAAILTAADKVEPFRIASTMEIQSGTSGLKDYPILSQARTLGPAFASRLAKILLDPKSYLIPGQDGKLCIFQPGVAFRVWRGSRFVDVIICFDCLQLMVVEDDPAVPLRSLGARSARFRVGGDFDAVAPALAQIVREAFPGDRSLDHLLRSRHAD